MNENPKKAVICDLILIFLCILLSVGVLFLTWQSKGDDGNAVTVSVTGRVTAVYPLDKDGVYPIESPYGHLTLTIENGQAFISESDCPDGTCRRMGKIKQTGDTLICLPARVLIRVGGQNGEVDAVV